MCNINVVLKKKKDNDRRTSDVMNAMSYNSFLNNNDGEGYLLFDGGELAEVSKSAKKIIYNGPCSGLATHQRIATSGHNNDNIHPFEVGNIILMHNGIISGFGDHKESDTKVYTKKLSKLYDETGDLVKSIKSLEISGSYSILIYDKINKRLIYFKNGNTHMHVIHNDEWIIMSTDKNNVKYAAMYLNIKTNLFTPKEFVIYELNNGLRKIGHIKKPEKTYTEDLSKYYSGFWDAAGRYATDETDDDKSNLYFGFINDKFCGDIYNIRTDYVDVVIPMLKDEFYNFFKETEFIAKIKDHIIIRVNRKELDKAVDDWTKIEQPISDLYRDERGD